MNRHRPLFRAAGVWALCSLLWSQVAALALPLPDPQAVSDASLVVIVRPDDRVPDGYRIEETLLNQDGVAVGDMLMLPGLRIETPSEDPPAVPVAPTPGAVTPEATPLAPVPQTALVPAAPSTIVRGAALLKPPPLRSLATESGAASVTLAVPPASATPAPVATPAPLNPPTNQPLFPIEPPPGSFPEAPIPKSPKYRKPPKPKKGKNPAAKPTPVPTPPPATSSPAPAPVVIPATPQLAPSANTTPQTPANAFPEAPSIGDGGLEVPAVEGGGTGTPAVEPFPIAPTTPLAGTHGAPANPPLTNPPAVPPTPNGAEPVEPSLLTPISPPVPGSVPTLTGGARILLFLWYAPETPGRYSLVRGGTPYAWVEDAANVGILRDQAKQILNARHRWENALSLRDPKARARALWPFLERSSRYRSLAQAGLIGLGTQGGNVIAANWKFSDSELRMSLLPTLSTYHSEMLHRTLIAHLRGLQGQYEDFLANKAGATSEQADDWDSLPEAAKSQYGELYYGLVGLAGFKDQRDLPFIRDLAWWALKYRFKQTDDAALDAFKAMPDPQNLTVIAQIWREYDTRPIAGNELAPAVIIATLDAHRFPATVPLLAGFLRNRNASVAASARASMRRIVGRDLGRDPMAWLHWFQRHEALQRAAKAALKDASLAAPVVKPVLAPRRMPPVKPVPKKVATKKAA